MPKALDADYRTNWLPAGLEAEHFSALKPYLDLVELEHGQVLYEPGGPIR
ncbi:hypothetical protein [Microvirga rosea]|nr:hypothetical protein [Microvirga rosea]MCB8821311.1 hypothetical protein [Microvirga rosea]